MAEITKMVYNLKVMKKAKFLILSIVYVLISFFCSINQIFASNIDGTIDGTYKYAWSENTGWINFGTTQGNVRVTDDGLTGYALGENIGWINLDEVNNDGEGNLSGYAWSENTGYIKFNPDNGGVIINGEGFFTGSALSENIGWIIFDGEYKVKTDWIRESPRSSRRSSGSRIIGYTSQEQAGNNLDVVVEKVWDSTKEVVTKIVDSIIPNFFKPKPQEEENIFVPIEEIVQKENVPLVFTGDWILIPSEPIRKFVLAPLPKEISKLAKKFPELGDTLEKVGVRKITDVVKLQDVDLSLPGLTERGGIVMSSGVPISDMSNDIKAKIPTEIVFAKAGGERIDFNIGVSINEDGKPEQKIKTIVGKPLKLALKPDHPVSGIKGYVIFKSKNDESLSKSPIINLPSNSLLAGAIFAHPVFGKTETKPIRIEQELLLFEFEYLDEDKDGIYTAEIEAPLVDGEYEIITVLTFSDKELGNKEIRLTTVIDPEGYVYEKYKDKEIRIPNANVSIYVLNNDSGLYESWDANKYQQKNPQKTGKSGAYSFLVPEGSYYIEATASDYLPYKSEIFEVTEGNGVHFNIELQGKGWWLKFFDWKSALLIIVTLLLLYNFYRDKIRDRISRMKKFN